MATLSFRRSNKEVMHKAGWKLDENEEGKTKRRGNPRFFNKIKMIFFPSKCKTKINFTKNGENEQVV